MSSAPVLDVQDLVVDFVTRGGRIHAVRGMSYAVGAGETLAIVGESGSGKSVSALAVLGLIPQPPGHVRAGRVLYAGRNLLELGESQFRRVRGNDIAMIFQEPMTSLNPVMKVGHQIIEAVRLHSNRDGATAYRHARHMLELVQIPEPERRLEQYPHELSGGMRQRVMIALAMSCNPRVLIADEPTTALDVTVQAQILDVMRSARDHTDAAIVLITHNLGVVAEMADRVVVAYAGQAVETGPVRAVLRQARHPYTQGLLASMPRLQKHSGGTGGDRLPEVSGQVPSPAQEFDGCPFAPRCPHALPRCSEEKQVLTPQTSRNHLAACWRAAEIGTPV